MQRGHVHRFIGVLQHLQGRGFEIGLCARAGAENGREIATQIEVAGIDVRWSPRRPDAPTRGRTLARTELVRTMDRDMLRRWYRARVERTLHPDRVAEVRQAIADLSPSVVVIDSLMYNAAVAAELEGVPWAAVTTMLLTVAPREWPSTQRDLAEDTAAWTLERMRELGAETVTLRGPDVVSPWLNVVFTTEAFVARSMSDNCSSFFVGPPRAVHTRGDDAKSGFPWERLRTDVPIVYVASGGGHAFSFGPAEYETICRSLGPEEAQFVCAVQHLEDHPVIRGLPEPTICVRYAPQVELLERHAAIVVTHGGQNTVDESLSCGRPLVVVPLWGDQEVVASAVQASGAGLVLPREGLTVEACRGAFRRLLEDGSFKAAAERIQRSFLAHNGSANAADLIARLAATRAPLLA